MNCEFSKVCQSTSHPMYFAIISFEIVSKPPNALDLIQNAILVTKPENVSAPRCRQKILGKWLQNLKKVKSHICAKGGGKVDPKGCLDGVVLDL